MLLTFAAFVLALAAVAVLVAAVRQSSPPPHRSRHRANPYLSLTDCRMNAPTVRIPIPRSNP